MSDEIMADAQKKLFVALLGAADDEASIYPEAVASLPLGWQNLLNLIKGRVNAGAINLSDYLMLLEYVIVYGDGAMLDKYLNIAEGLSGEEYIYIADKLLFYQDYARALDFYARITANDAVVTGEFWLSVGKCLWALGESAPALEAFTQAETMGVTSSELSSYLAWCIKVVGP